MITSDQSIPDSVRSMLTAIADSIGTTPDIIARQLIIWVTDRLVEAKENLKFKLSEKDIQLIKNAFCSKLMSINNIPDIKAICKNIPRNETEARAAIHELDQFEMLYFAMNSICATKNNDGVRLVNAAEFGKLMTPPRNKVSVVRHIHNGRIPGARHRGNSNLWLLPSNYAAILSKEIDENIERKKKRNSEKVCD